MKKFKQFMLAALVVGFGYPVSAWAFNDLTQGQQQGQIGINKQGQAQGQAQGQQQGQGQGQAQGQIGINKSKNTNKNANLNANFNKNSNKNKATGIGLGVGLGKAKASNSGNNTNVRVEGDDNDYPVSTATAPGGVPGDCMGSSGLGVQTFVVGVSGGSNWFDEKCRTERRAKMLTGVAQVALLCEDDETRKAIMIAHKLDPKSKPCPQDQLEAQTAEKNAAKYYRDPASGKIVRLETGAKMPIHRVALVPLDGAPDNVTWNDDKHTVAMHTAAE